MVERFDPTATITDMRAVAPKATAEDAAARALLAALPLPAFVKSYASEPAVYHYVNHAAERVFGFRVGQLIGYSDYDLFPRPDADRARLQDVEAMELELPYISDHYLPFATIGGARVYLFRLPFTRIAGIVWSGL